MEELLSPFDFCISFSGACAGAMQLNRRGLRLASMPFDWVRGGDKEKFLDTMATFMETRFAGWCQYENLVPMPKEQDYPPATDPLEVRAWDTVYDMGFYHDFRYNIFVPDGREYFDGIRERYRRRIDRFYNFLSRSQRVLGVLVAPEGPFSREKVKSFKERIDALNPGTVFTLVNLNYQAREDGVYEDRERRIVVFDLERKLHTYDFFSTSCEWSFLDDVRLTGRVRAEMEVTSASSGMPLWYRLHRRLYMHCKKAIGKGDVN